MKWSHTVQRNNRGRASEQEPFEILEGQRATLLRNRSDSIGHSSLQECNLLRRRLSVFTPVIYCGDNKLRLELTLSAHAPIILAIWKPDASPEKYDLDANCAAATFARSYRVFDPSIEVSDA